MPTVSANKPSILITGCSTGIGFDAAVTLQSLNFEVFATARKQQDVEKLRALGLKAKRLDLTDESSIENAVKWVLSETGGTLYALFNNGAYGQPGALEDLPIDALPFKIDYIPLKYPLPNVLKLNITD